MMNELKAVSPEQLARSMSNAGIPKIFHGRSLKEFGKAGQTLLTLTDADDFLANIRKGQGFIFQNKDPLDGDIAPVFAKAIRMFPRVNARVTKPLHILYHLKGDEDYSYVFDDVDRMEALIIRDFFVTDKAGKTGVAISGEELERVSDYISGFVENGVSVSVQCSTPLTETSPWNWYLVKRLKELNEVIDL